MAAVHSVQGSLDKPSLLCWLCQKVTGGSVLKMSRWVSNGLLGLTPQSTGIGLEAAHHTVMVAL